MGEENWNCLHDGPRHSADFQGVEMTRKGYSTEIGILRCRTCGGLYRWYRFEISDWSGGNDYGDETQVWQVLAEDEVERVRTDDNYEPRGGREHRHNGGWKSIGP